jgi:hypothetical protein
MKKNRITSIIFIVGALMYAFSFIATSKKQIEPPNPCKIAGENWFYADSNLYKYHNLANINDDTVLIRADTLRTTNWNTITDSLCKIYKANCNNYNIKILVINYRDTIPSHRDTWHGKKILFKNCQ